jgi:predicted RNA-binding protein with PUA-like domain
MGKKYWLMKSEPSVFSFQDLMASKKQVTSWDGVRNYQARNFMRDEMEIGDQVLFYHSSCDVPGIYGLAEVSKLAYPDPSSWDPKSKYFDAKSTPENPRWFMVDVVGRQAFKNPLTLEGIKKTKSLSEMLVVKKGQRLSIQPVLKKHFDIILNKTS